MTTINLNNVKVGDELPTLQLPPVRRFDLAMFAGSSGDHNPIHIDLDFAKKAGYPDVFAQGMLSMAWLGRLMTNWAPQTRLRSLSGRFTNMTHLQDVITCSGKVTEIFEANGERRARVAIQTANQEGKVTIGGEAVVALG